MNKVSNFTFVSLIMLPALLLFFQNCSELVTSESGISSYNNSSIKLPPLVLSSSTQLGFVTQTDCTSEEVTLYKTENHLCFNTVNNCEVEFLTENGFAPDSENLCSSGVNFESFNADLLSNKNLAELGYEQSEELICSQQYQDMINLKSGSCSQARDGCQISYLESLGFSEDSLNLCN